METDNNGTSGLLSKCCSLDNDIQTINQQNSTLTQERDGIYTRLENGACLKKRYRKLKAEKKAASDMNGHLKKKSNT